MTATGLTVRDSTRPIICTRSSKIGVRLGGRAVEERRALDVEDLDDQPLVGDAGADVLRAADRPPWRRRCRRAAPARPRRGSRPACPARRCVSGSPFCPVSSLGEHVLAEHAVAVERAVAAAAALVDRDRRAEIVGEPEPRLLVGGRRAATSAGRTPSSPSRSRRRPPSRRRRDGRPPPPSCA